MEFRSNEIMHNEDSPFYRSLFKSIGYSDYELDHRPLIGIANTWNTCVLGHFNLSQVNEFVKKGIYSTGGTTVEFDTVGCCDGMTQGHVGMNYILPSREITCNSIGVMIRAYRLDDIVLLASCDKIVPGMLIAAACLDVPVIVCISGPMLEGIEFDGRKPGLTSIDEAKGMTRSGKITGDEYRSLENMACPRYGSCSFLGATSSMCCISEAMGVSLPGSALILAPYGERLKSFSEAGCAVVSLAMNNITAKQATTKESIRNAIRVTMAVYGSTNAALHIAAITNEAKLDMNVVEEFRTLNLTTPQTVRVSPMTKRGMETFYRAGGIPRVMDRLGSVIDRSAVTCTGKSVDEGLKDQMYWYPESREVIRAVNEPFPRTGGVAVLSGNLAPDMTVSKPGAIDPTLYRFTGRAGCYNPEEEAESAILSGEIQRGEVVVIRYGGPKGDPGMREMFKVAKYVYSMGLAKDTALITNGRFPGINNRCFVRHISLETAEGGPLALVEDEGEIMIDVAKGKLEPHVSDEIISTYRKHWVKPEKEIPDDYLEPCSKVASSADKDAIIQC